MIRDNADAKTILEMVRTGDLSPQEAEEWATNHDLPPFAGKPDPQGLDPMTEPLWTIPMALAWFIWRTRDAVIETTDEYRRNWREWTTVQGDSDNLDDRVWDLKPVAKMSVADLLRHPDINRLPTDRLFDPSIFDPTLPFFVGQSSPYQRFLNAVELGQIHASAISSKSGGRKSRRVPFPFLILRLRSSLDSIRKRRPPEAAAHHVITRGRGPALPDYSEDGQLDYLDIRVPHDEVISADIRASRLDYKWESWTTEYALGWIAYREIDKFRLLSPTNLGTLATADTERRLGVKHIHPDAKLLSALREGQLIARPSIEAMHLGDPNPIPPDWWKDRTLPDAPHLRFVRDDVTTTWTVTEEIASSGVVRDIEIGNDGSTTSLLAAPSVDPWESAKKLTFLEFNVILEAKRHWPDCQCRLRDKDVYDTILTKWDLDKLGPPCHEVTIKRALKKIPAWNAWREGNLVERVTGHRAVDKTFP
jgi:hypothetical protein